MLKPALALSIALVAGEAWGSGCVGYQAPAMLSEIMAETEVRLAIPVERRITEQGEVSTRHHVVDSLGLKSSRWFNSLSRPDDGLNAYRWDRTPPLAHLIVLEITREGGGKPRLPVCPTGRYAYALHHQLGGGDLHVPDYLTCHPASEDHGFLSDIRRMRNLAYDPSQVGCAYYRTGDPSNFVTLRYDARLEDARARAEKFRARPAVEGPMFKGNAFVWGRAIRHSLAADDKAHAWIFVETDYSGNAPDILHVRVSKAAGDSEAAIHVGVPSFFAVSGGHTEQIRETEMGFGVNTTIYEAVTGVPWPAGCDTSHFNVSASCQSAHERYDDAMRRLPDAESGRANAFAALERLGAPGTSQR